MTLPSRLLAMALTTVSVGCGSRTALDAPLGVDSADASDGKASDAREDDAATCPDSPSMPARISTLAVSLYYQPVTLVVVGLYAYVGLWNGDSGGEIVRVSLEGGHLDVLASTYDDSPLAADSNHLFFSPATLLAPDVTAHTKLTSIDLTTLLSTDVPVPVAPSGQYYVNGYAITPHGVMWLEAAEAMDADPQVTFLDRSDGSQSATISTMSQFGSDLVVGTRDAFVLGVDQGFQDEGLYRVPLSGAPPTQMKSFVTYESPMLIGAVGNDVIYTPDRLAIVRTSDVGDTTLVTNANLDTCESSAFCQHRRVWLDDAWLYYVANASITRVNLATRASEVVFQADSDHALATVTADACNVYWTGIEPGQRWAHEPL